MRPTPAPTRTDITRRWCIPPALLTEPNETLEGLHVLHEVAADGGLVLWCTLRDVTLWASTPPAQRGALFRADAAARRRAGVLAAWESAPLRDPLLVIADLLRDPEGADTSTIAAACLAVAGELEQRGALRSAVSFTQAGALAVPTDPDLALRTGTVARRAGSHARAATWLRRAVALARRAARWDSYTAALLALGDLHADHGDPRLARRHYVRAVRSIRRHAIHAPLRGAAFHRLFRLARDTGEAQEAGRMALRARRRYRGGPPEPMHELTHEVAAWRLDTGFPARAVALLRPLAPQRTRPLARLESLILLARAAALAGERPLFESAWHDAWALVHELGDAQVPREWTVAMGEAARLHASVGV